MFERFTERARRTLFFARYEATQIGGASIGTEHLLLGLLREGKGPTSQIFARSHLSLEGLRREVQARIVSRETLSTAVEIPFTAEVKRVLQFAAAEADGLKHSYIGAEHLLLGILREEGCIAASVLIEKGMRIDVVRTEIERLRTDEQPASTSATPGRYVQIVLQLYDAFRRGDASAILTLLSPNVEWIEPANPFNPAAGTRRGEAGFREWLRVGHESEEILVLEPRQILSSSDSVAVVGHSKCLAKPTGRTYETDFVHVVTFRDNEIIRFQEFFDTFAAAEAFRP
jgi:ketosteroid isomerase-like protein